MSSEKNLHVISFDVPYPADYGGVIDIFYKLKSLHEAGIKLHLHCFEYGRKPQEELNKICASVYYYPRKKAKSLLFNTLPYVVLSRTSEELKKKVLHDDFPILMEGLHSTFLLADKEFISAARFAGRKMVVRTHNVEHDYYKNLATVEHNIFKRYYFYNEAGKLGKYESVLQQATSIAPISPDDTAYYSSHFKNVRYVPAFHPDAKVISRAGQGNFAFYHGNLAVGENNEAALYLVNKIFNDLPFRLVIAGSRPSDELLKAIRGKQNIEMKAQLSPSQIHDLIGQAQCNVLPTFQSTGIKLKLLASLFAGRFCIVNSLMVKNTGLEKLCIVADTPSLMKDKIRFVMDSEFTKEAIEKRKKILEEKFSNAKNVISLFELLF